MPFALTAPDLANATLFVVPIYAYGWHRINEDRSWSHSGEVSPPPPFRLRLLEFFKSVDLPTVVFGKIEEARHPLNNRWVALFPVMDDSSVDLENEAANFGTLICPARPDFDPTVRPVNDPRIVNTASTPNLRGISVACTRRDPISAKLGRSCSLPGEE